MLIIFKTVFYTLREEVFRMTFKICVVGCGWITAAQHGPALKLYESLHENTKVVACCDVIEERAKEVAEQLDIPNYYTDMEKMLDTEKPDVVCLNVTVAYTAELACKILEKGYPLIVEKPPGVNLQEANKMIEAAKGIPNRIAFNRRYMPLVQKAIEVVNGWGGTNCIMDIRYRMTRVMRNEPDFSTTAIHGIDVVKYIADSDYKNVNFRYLEIEGHAPAANYYLSGVMENGIVVNLDFLPVSGIVTERLEINTHKGMIFIEMPMGVTHFDKLGRLIVFEDGKETLTITGDEDAGAFVGGGFYKENADFFNDLRNNKQTSGDIASGLQSLEIANCISDRIMNY